MTARVIEELWDRDGAGATLLTPLAWLFAAGTAIRNAAYDRGWLTTQALGAPTVSVGNLSVGGTGKTPVSAWLAQALRARGRRPAILLRGYGADEPLVHSRLTPDAIVVADADRVRGAATARAQGATAFVLDDGFQHRRARRDLDLVLVAAEHAGRRRLLPAGPLREPPRALLRADALVVTRKSASLDAARAAAAEWGAYAPGRPQVVVALQPGDLVAVPGAAAGENPARAPLAALAGMPVLAISAIGAPAAFESQLRACGAVVTAAAYGDHHAFSRADAEVLARRVPAAGMAVCTLKDAVKLEQVWPREGPPLWYLSQAVAVEAGGEVLAGLLDRLVAVQPP